MSDQVRVADAAGTSLTIMRNGDIMLILSRKLGESIVIGEDIVIRIVELRRSRVRIGIEAPFQVRIRRGEHLENETFRLDRQIGQIDDLSFGDEFELETASTVRC